MLSVVASWATAKIGYDVRPVHMWLGYWMLGLLMFRVLWGLVGTRHARFTAFTPGPRAIIRYLRDLISGKGRESVGHNPLGSLMVYAMLIVVGLQAVSGLFVFDDIMYGGPYSSVVSEAVSERWTNLHHSLINVIYVFVAVHLAAVLFYALVKRQRLIRAMLTGRKKADVVPEHEAIAGSRLPLAIFVALISAAVTFWLVAIAPAG